MKTHIQKKTASDSVKNSPLKQGQVGNILQNYRENTTQLTKNENSVLQKVDAAEAPKLESAYNTAMATGTMKEDVYLDSLRSLDYTFEDDYSDEAEDPAVQLKSILPIQLARSAHSISGPKDYGSLKKILYQTDDKGNIDFKSPKQYHLGNPYPGLNPVTPSSETDITSAVTAHGTTNRYQHFKQANINLPGFNGSNGSSPSGLTWHHLTDKYKMHLVDRTVHSKHGHNGGVHIW